MLCVSVSASHENRIPIYRDELDERSESKTERECSLSLSVKEIDKSECECEL